MKRIRRIWWSAFALVTLTWLIAESGVLTSSGTVGFRHLLLQYSGLLAMTWMSIAMILAARPKWPERWFGGLDKMYRLHKWVGISALVVSLVHWLGVNVPKWGGALGLMQRGPRGPRAVPEIPLSSGFWGFAEPPRPLANGHSTLWWYSSSYRSSSGFPTDSSTRRIVYWPYVISPWSSIPWYSRSSHTGQLR